MSIKYPSDSDLRRLLRFEPNSGAIWLGGRKGLAIITSCSRRTVLVGDRS
jgi:hypothetical protein